MNWTMSGTALTESAHPRGHGAGSAAKTHFSSLSTHTSWAQLVKMGEH